MAKMNGDFSFNGPLGNICAYKMKGVDQVILRTKGGAKKQKIKRDPSCAGILKNATEFGGPSKASKSIRNALYPVLHVADQNLAGAFTGLAKSIQQMDTESKWGERNVLLSQYGRLLEGFNLNKRIGWESISSGPLSGSIFRNTASATVQLPAMLPGINFFVPGTFALFRCIVVLGVTHDMLYAPSGYEPAPFQPFMYPVCQYTEWLSTAMPFQGEAFKLTLKDNPVLSATDTLLLSVGIEFGIPAGNNEVKSVKHLGAARIIAVA